MTLDGKEKTAIVISLAMVVLAVVLVLCSLTSHCLIWAVIILLAAEVAKTLFLVKRFSANGGKNGLGETIVAELLTFLAAAALVALLVYSCGDLRIVSASAFCASFVMFRVASGLVIFCRS